MAHIKIKKGYTVPILGEPQGAPEAMSHPAFVGVCPVGFPGLKPRLDVKVNDEVKIGSPLYHDKKAEEIKFLSPAAGRVTAINYGPRRVIEEIIIARNDSEDAVAFPKHTLGGIAALGRDELVSQLLAGGVWPYIRRRPFNKIAGVDDTPKGIFINAMDTAPLAADPVVALKDDGEAFAAGVAAAKVLCEKVYISTAPGVGAPFAGIDGVGYYTFEGKHPAGLTGTHIGKIDPINKGETVWHLNARDVVAIGSLLLTGTFPTKRTVAVSGPGVKSPKYVTTRMGVRLSDLVAGNVNDGEMRYVSGTVLNGTTKNAESFLGFYDGTLTVLAEGRKQELVGWMMPGFSKPSFTRVFVSGILGGKKFPMNTNVNGGRRAIVASGMWESVMGLDVFPEHLAKACVAQDIDAMEQLGILECDPEDFALCTYVDPSKTEVSQMIADGLELIEKEG